MALTDVHITQRFEAAVYDGVEPLYRHHANGVELIGEDLLKTPLDRDKETLALEIVKDVYEYTIENNMVEPLAGAQILAQTRTRGPVEYKIRNDGHSSYTHEFSQQYYFIWMAAMQEDVLNRVVNIRKARGPVSDADIESWRQQLAKECSPEQMRIYLTVACWHDLGEDYKRNAGGLVRRLCRLTKLSPKARTIRGIKRGFVAMTRRRMRDGSKEPVEVYMERVTADWEIAVNKAADIIHNNATLLRSRLPTEKILKQLRKRELFLDLVEKKLGHQCIMLDYACAYIKDQNDLIRTALMTDFENEKSKQELVDRMNKLRHGYRESWIPKLIHPMMCIVERIQEDIDDDFKMCNPPAPEQVLAAAPLAPPSFDRLQPRAA